MARRGHKLLKDKRDELMRQFMELVESVRELRLEVEGKLSRAMKDFLIARMQMSSSEIGVSYCIRLGFLTLRSLSPVPWE